MFARKLSKIDASCAMGAKYGKFTKIWSDDRFDVYEGSIMSFSRSGRSYGRRSANSYYIYAVNKINQHWGGSFEVRSANDTSEKAIKEAKKVLWTAMKEERQ